MNEPRPGRVRRLDSIPLDMTYFTDEGYLVDHPIVTSVGIFVYHNPDGSERRELRLPEEVFAVKALPPTRASRSLSPMRPGTSIPRMCRRNTSGRSCLKAIRTGTMCEPKSSFTIWTP